MDRPDQGNKAQTRCTVFPWHWGLYWRPGYGSHGGNSSGYPGSCRVGKKVARLDERLQ